MNDLIRVENGEVKIDSRMIADHFGKEHKNVMRDIQNEIESLEKSGLCDALIFEPIQYLDSMKRKREAFEMGEEGAMQLAARYDAVSRRKLILKIKELKTQTQQRVPQSPMEFIAMMAQQSLEQEKQIQKVTGDVQTIKDAMLPETDNWRTNTNTKINRIVMARGGVRNDHIAIRRESYEMLERTAKADLDRRLQGLQDRLRRTGAKASAIKAASKMDIIENDPKLRAIYSGVIEKMVIKYC